MFLYKKKKHGDWDVHWGYDSDFDPWPFVDSWVEESAEKPE